MQINECVAICRQNKQVLWDNGIVSDIDQMFDRWSDETDDITEAVVCIAFAPDGNWHVIDMRDYQAQTCH